MTKFENITANEIIKKTVELFRPSGEYASRSALGFAIIAACTEWENVFTGYVNDFRKAAYVWQLSFKYDGGTTESDDNAASELLRDVLNAQYDAAKRDAKKGLTDLVEYAFYGIDDDVCFGAWLGSLCNNPYED